MKNRVKLAGVEASIDIDGHHMVVTVKDHDPAYVLSIDGGTALTEQALALLGHKLNESAHVRWRTFTYDVDMPVDLALPCGAEWLGNRDDTYQCDSPDGHDGPHTFSLDGGTLRWDGGSDA